MDVDVEQYKAQLKVVEVALTTADNKQRVDLLELKKNLLELLELSNGGTIETNKYSENAGSELCEKENQLQSLKITLEELIGKECAAPHQHTWGSVVYHNAFVCGVGDGVEVDNDGINTDVRVRVLFTNPTHREMIPCQYFLDGNCRFDENTCRFSHGELVSFKQLHDYVQPNFDLLSRNCVVLAKLKDRLWYRGKVLNVNLLEKSCLIRLESKEHKPRERHFNFEEIFPIFQDDTDSSASSDDNYLSDESDTKDVKAAQHAILVKRSLLTCEPIQALGDWEKHTRGIGSKLMLKMGYVIGTGLGSDGHGIITPVSTQILPQGRSLDYCMELREQGNGNEDFFSVERKLKQKKKKHIANDATAYEREAKRVDVFSFLNNSILGSTSLKSVTNSSTPDKLRDLSEHTTRSLNVECVRIADSIRHKEREISKIRKSLTRNVTDNAIQKKLQSELNFRIDELASLQRQEHKVTKEQIARKTKDKLTVF